MKRKNSETILVTGGAGFMGSCFTNLLVATHPHTRVVVVDALTSVADKKNLHVWSSKNFVFRRCDIRNARSLERIFAEFKPTSVVHFAAETHVDASIENPALFLETNVFGTYNIAAASRAHGVDRILHISTDEVYGTLTKKAAPFSEAHPVLPNSPYSASKASAEHILRSFRETYGLPILIARSSNNYGPGQDKTKFIPVCITKLLHGEKIPLYGKGTNIRDWVYVEDSAAAFMTILKKGVVGEVYNVGATYELRNIDVVKKILAITGNTSQMISYVTDRPGHDFRYALSTAKIRRLGWKPRVSFDEGLRRTVEYFRLRN
jgi:dTDP-glucose 4,6-dehydratase